LFGLLGPSPVSVLALSAQHVAKGRFTGHVNPLIGKRRDDASWRSISKAGIVGTLNTRARSAGVSACAGVGLIAMGQYYSGFWLIRASNSEQAEQLALEGSKACNRRVELRPLLA
jgi:hypothetical protein